MNGGTRSHLQAGPRDLPLGACADHCLAARTVALDGVQPVVGPDDETVDGHGSVRPSDDGGSHRGGQTSDLGEARNLVHGGAIVRVFSEL